MNTLLPWLSRCVAVMVLAGCLFAEQAVRDSASSIGSLFREVEAVLRDRSLQWMVAACLGIYCASFLLMEHRTQEAGTQRTWWHRAAFPFFMGVAFVRYILDYSTASQSFEAITLFGTAVIGQAFGFWVSRKTRAGIFDPASFIAAAIALLLCGAALWHPHRDYLEFAYLGRERWTGPWTNPNTFGTLIGAGVVLVAGMLAWSWRFRRQWCARVALIVCPCALLLLAYALAHSYSRGAWVATAAGLASLVLCMMSDQRGEDNLEAQQSRNGWYPWLWPLAISAVSVLVLVALNFRGSEFAPLRRVASMANPNDFSWRNRVASWEGSLQMMADKPLLGHGWGRGEKLYSNFYLPPRIESGGAIQMNDYLGIGTAIGTPALVALMALLVGSVTRLLEGGTGVGSALGAAALVLAVAFWFDGGMFKLSTGALFWILYFSHRSRRCDLSKIIP